MGGAERAPKAIRFISHLRLRISRNCQRLAKHQIYKAEKGDKKETHRIEHHKEKKQK
jgi:hypothetical protein